MTSHVIDDREVNTRTSDPVSTRTNDLATRNDRDVRRPASDIHDRGRMRIAGADATTKRRRQTFLDHPDATDASVLRRTQQRASFNRRDVREDAHQRATAKAGE